MAQLEDGDSAEVQGSARKPYVLKNRGGVYSCTCPAWLNQSVGIERRTCKHLKKYLGEEVELARVGGPGVVVPPRPKRTPEKAGGGAAPPLLLAHSWETDVDLVGWWMSEKLDGVRAWWDGKTFWSRQGNEFMAPPFFTDGLPDTILDGELWVARKKFQRTVSIVRRQDRSAEWAELTYVVFDAPSFPGSFEQRIAEVAKLLGEKVKHARPHPHEPCRDVAHLKAELQRVEGLGGEGLMLRKPGSKYEAGRSHTLLKVKSFLDDEARVIGHLPGAGRHKGRLGAVEAQLADGTLFSVGTGFSDAEREAPPAIGSIITVRYQELSEDGVPRFPTYVGVRIDHDFEEKVKKAKRKS